MKEFHFFEAAWAEILEHLLKGARRWENKTATLFAFISRNASPIGCCLRHGVHVSSLENFAKFFKNFASLRRRRSASLYLEPSPTC